MILSIVGFLLIVILEARKIKGSFIISIIIVSILSYLFTDNTIDGVVGAIPKFTTFFALDFSVSSLLNISFIVIVFSLLFVDFFDSTATLLAVAPAIDTEHQNIDTRRPLIIDSLATVLGSLLGTSTATIYIESGAGIKQGGRTGLTAVVVGLLFLLCLFFFPFIYSIPSYATAPVLIYIGFLFVQNLKLLDLSDTLSIIPALITSIMMPLTVSISHGIIFGILTYMVIEVSRGKAKHISPIMWALAGLSLGYLLV